jgi:hypothetical protein
MELASGIEDYFRSSMLELGDLEKSPAHDLRPGSSPQGVRAGARMFLECPMAVQMKVAH